ncbi:MAG: hypothetical protein AB8G05_22790 [Oligoflexales bacterium]
MIKNLIIGLGLISGLSFASEDPSPREKKKHGLCLVKAQLLGYHQLEKCDSQGDPDCYSKAWKQNLEYLKSCLQNAKSDEDK